MHIVSMSISSVVSLCAQCNWCTLSVKTFIEDTHSIATAMWHLLYYISSEIVEPWCGECMTAKAYWTCPLNNGRDDNTGDMNGTIVYHRWYNMDSTKDIKFMLIHYYFAISQYNINFCWIHFQVGARAICAHVMGSRHKDCWKLFDAIILNRL